MKAEHWVMALGIIIGFLIVLARLSFAQAEAEVACFVKQLGKNPYEAPEGIGPNTSGPDSVKCRLVELDINKSHGGDMLEWPEDLRVREFPSRRGL